MSGPAWKPLEAFTEDPEALAVLECRAAEAEDALSAGRALGALKRCPA